MINSYGKMKNNEPESILGDLEVPEAIADAQEMKIELRKEKNGLPKVHLFFSFDIVNSTLYKTLTFNWPIIIKELLEDIRTRVFRASGLETCILWRVIGDEMIFVLPVHKKESVLLAIDAIFEVTQRISISLKSGKFFETLKDQSLQTNEINILKTQNTLSIKSAAWIAVVNDKTDSPYDNISFDYSASSQNQTMKEYLGKDIDAGFRLKAYTQDRRLAVSFELAYLLKQQNNKLHILDYVRLKGVWNEALYPVIWYYNEKCIKELSNTENVSFQESFRYDETDNNPIVKRYFDRGNAKKRKQDSKWNNMEDGQTELEDGMYQIDSALDKILKDRNLAPKMQYIESLFKTEDIMHIYPYLEPLELHCAVVCCDVEHRKVLIIQRGAEHRNNPNKWEFGCAKASSDKNLIQSITDYYKTTFGVDIELVIDSSRNEQQPLPIAFYELKRNKNIKKGIIFLARVINSIEPEAFRPEVSYNQIKWIYESEVKNYPKTETISDFHATLKKVFDNFDNYFMGEDKNEGTF